MRAFLLIALLPAAALSQTPVRNLNDRYGEVNLEKLHGIDTYKTEGAKKVLVDRAINSKVPWVGSWWAYAYTGSYTNASLAHDGIGFRWKSSTELSPAEKWDTYVGRANKIEHAKLTQYISGVKTTWNPKAARRQTLLGTVNKLIAQNKNNAGYDWRKSDAGSEYVKLTNEINTGKTQLAALVTVDTAYEWEVINHGHGSVGAQGWWGHCNAWAGAGVLEPEPVRDVTVGGIHWFVGDLKALLTEVWMESYSSFFGTRNESDDDATVRAEVDFKDVTPANFHIFFADQIGNKDKSFVIDRYTGSEVWNHPVRGYQTKLVPLYTVQSGVPKPVRKEVKLTKYTDDGGQETSLGSIDVYPVQATTTVHWLDDGVPEDAINMPNINRIDSYDEFANSSVILSRYNHFVSVRTLSYVLNLSAPIGDAKAQIIGDGEWKHADPSGLHNQPDFMWQPTGNYPSRRNYENPFVDATKLVKELLPNAVANSGGAVVTPPVGAPKVYKAAGGLPLAIPDAVAAGTNHKISVPDDTKIGTAVLELDITHTYKGDLAVTLSHGGVDRVIKKQGEGGSEDHVKGKFDLPVFRGVTAKGDWVLKMVDSDAQDLGNLVGWSLTVTP